MANPSNNHRSLPRAASLSYEGLMEVAWCLPQTRSVGDQINIRITAGPVRGVGAGPRAGYTPGMKTAISIPDDVFQAAERVAAELKQSRSQLYSCAVKEYVARHSADSVTVALDAVYGGEADQSELEFLRVAARQALEHSEW